MRTKSLSIGLGMLAILFLIPTAYGAFFYPTNVNCSPGEYVNGFCVTSDMRTDHCSDGTVDLWEACDPGHVEYQFCDAGNGATGVLTLGCNATCDAYNPGTCQPLAANVQTFWTGDASAITYAGNVGVGTVPGYSLDVRNTTASGAAIANVSNDNATSLWTGLRLARGATPAEKWFIGMDDTTDNLLFRRGGTTNDMVIDSTGKVGIRSSDTSLSTVAYPVTIEHETSGVPTDGFGSGLVFAGKTSTNSGRTMATIVGYWNDPADATRKGSLSFETVNNGVLVENMTIGHDGKVGIGTDPLNETVALLSVNGQIKIMGGSPGANKVLTSDANGLATWQASQGTTYTGTAPINVSGTVISLGGIGSSNITDGTIANADISATAAIATSKISGLGALATLAAVSGGTAGTITDATITDADVSATAAIAKSKLSGVAGSGANSDITSLTAVTSIGSSAGLSLTTASNGNITLTPNGTGNVGIGAAPTGTYKLEVTGSSGIGAAAYYYTSDATLKKNIQTLTNALDKIEKLRGVSFNWKSDGKAQIGLIAQEVEKVIPDVVSTGNNGLKSVEYGNLVAVLIEGMKEQQKQIEALQAEITTLKANLK
jgi:hypothetical protein